MNRVGNSISTEGLRSHAVRFREHLVERLLSERNENGHWEGRLSHSALSTATAITALYLFGQHGGSGSNNDKQLIDGGAAWLVKHQNDDGGWGDTDKSYSNISTNDDNDGGDGAGNDEVTHEKRNRRKDYWLFIFPFQIHEAWVVVASVVNFLLLLNSFGVHSMIRLVVTFFSMALLLIVAAQYLGAPYEPNYVVPVVFVWALVS